MYKCGLEINAAVESARRSHRGIAVGEEAALVVPGGVNWRHRAETSCYQARSTSGGGNAPLAPRAGEQTYDSLRPHCPRTAGSRKHGSWKPKSGALWRQPPPVPPRFSVSSEKAT